MEVTITNSLTTTRVTKGTDRITDRITRGTDKTEEMATWIATEITAVVLPCEVSSEVSEVLQEEDKEVEDR